MAIRYNEKENTLTLVTKSSAYQMKIDSLGTVIHTGYGAWADDDLSYALCGENRGLSGNPYEMGRVDRTYSLDTKPQEYTGYGIGDYRATACRVRHENGTKVLQLRYKDHRIQQGKYSLPDLPASYDETGKAETLELDLLDEQAGFLVTLFYGVFEDSDVITRAVRFTNISKEVKYLEKAASINLDFTGASYDLITFHGKWAKERVPERRKVPFGTTAIGSVRGASSPHLNPSAILAEEGTTEDHGRAYGMALVYSGEFLMETDKDQTEQTRVLMGIQPEGFSWKLNPGETFSTPEVLLTYSEEGISGVSLSFHRFIRKHIVNGPWRDQRRPILVNNWEGTYFDFTGEKLVSMAKEAAELGIEMFVLDDGWFGKRDDDNSGLGDWYPNEKKLGCTMEELGKAITGNGMRFGIWFEPETVCEDSDLYRNHPDWTIMVPGRLPNLSRNELLVDMGRKDVQDYLIESMSKVIREGNISYVKWDFNRSLCDKYSAVLPADQQGEVAHRFTLGTYRVLQALRTEFPDLLIEGCSSGGGRFDCGMLYYTPQIWCSDNTDAIERLTIQNGTSYIYPVNTMGAHVSASPNHQTGRRTPMDTRAAVAMSGTFGYELDVNRLTEDEKAEVKRELKVYRALCDVLQYGDYYRLSAPDSAACTAWEQVREDGSQAVVTAVYHYVNANQVPVYVRLKGLKAEAKYRITLADDRDLKKLHAEQQRLFGGETLVSGKALMDRGIYIPFSTREYQPWQIIFTEE